MLPFYVPRPIMPQIDEADYPEFIAFLGGIPVVCHRRVVHPRELRAHQRIDPIKSSRMTDAIRAKPIWTSEDNFVLDGNHRWLAHMMEDTPIDCWTIDRVFEEAIDLMFSFPRTFSLNMHPETN